MRKVVVTAIFGSRHEVTVWGSSYVGLVSGDCQAWVGNHVICVDVDRAKFERLQNGEVPIYEPGLEAIVREALAEGTLRFTTDAAVATALRWGTLKDARRWSRAQLIAMHQLTHSNLRTARAWRLKEALRTLFEQANAGADAEPLLRCWISWARRCRLAPFKRLGATLREHLPGIVNSFRLGLSNATAESINAKVQVAIARARGFRTLKHLMAIVYLIAGKLTYLPAPAFARLGTVS